MTNVALDRVTDEVTSSQIFRIRGQMSRWKYPDPYNRLTPEHCEILTNVNISERGIAESRNGYVKYNNATLTGGETVVGLWQGKFSNGETKQVVVTPTKVYSDPGGTGSARVDITGSDLTGSANDLVNFSFTKNQLILNNTVDPPRVWNGDDDSSPTNTSNLSAIANAQVPFTKAKCMIVHKNLLMAFGTTEGGTYYPTRARWCDINRRTYVVDISVWRADNLYEIYDGGPAIVAAADAWGKALIFKEDGMYPGEVIFAPQPGHYDFQIDRPQRGFSPISRMGVVARPEFVMCPAREGLVVIRPDLSFEVANSDDVTTWLGLNQNRLANTQSFVREREHQVRLLCNSSGSSSGHDKVLVWDWETNDTWLDEPADSINYGANLVISDNELDWLGSTSGVLFRGNEADSTTDNGNGIDWLIKMSPNDLGMPGKLKHILNIRTIHRRRAAEQTVSMRVHIDQGRGATVTGLLSIGSTELTWDSGIFWNDDKRWVGSGSRVSDFYVNRVCETVAPEWWSSDPAAIEGYQVEYIPLEN